MLHELSKGSKTAREVAEAQVIREDYIHRAKIQRRRKRVTTLGRRLERKRHATLWSLTTEGTVRLDAVLERGPRAFDEIDRRRYKALRVGESPLGKRLLAILARNG